MRANFRQFSGHILHRFLIPLSQFSESKAFTLGQFKYDNRADLTDHIKEQSFALGLSYMEITRENPHQIAVSYSDPSDYCLLLHIAYGDIKAEYNITLPVAANQKQHAYDYLESLREHGQNSDLKTKFLLTDDLNIKAKINCLQTVCHIINLHRRGDIMRLAIATRKDPYQRSHLLPTPEPLLLTSDIKNYSIPLELPCHITNLPRFRDNFMAVCRQHDMSADFKLAGEHPRRIVVSTNNSHHAMQLMKLFHDGVFNVGLHHRTILTTVGQEKRTPIWGINA